MRLIRFVQQGTQRSVQTYAVHGRAVRAALSLGLQSSDALRRFSPLDQEMRKRTWYACVMIDRNLSMTFGRPPSIPDLYVKLPLPTTIRSAHGIPMGMPAQPNVFKSYGLNFFNATIDLYKIMSRVLESMYGQNLGCGDNESVGAMLSKHTFTSSYHSKSSYGCSYIRRSYPSFRRRSQRLVQAGR